MTDSPAVRRRTVCFDLLLENIIYAIYGIIFLLVDDFRVDLSCGDILVSQQFACRVKVNIERKHEGGEGVAAHMKCDLLLHSGGFRPVAEYDAHAACGRQAENPVIVTGVATLRKPFHSLRREGKINRCVGFLHDNGHAPLLAVLMDLTPPQGADVARAKPAVT